MTFREYLRANYSPVTANIYDRRVRAILYALHAVPDKDLAFREYIQDLHSSSAQQAKSAWNAYMSWSNDTTEGPRPIQIDISGPRKIGNRRRRSGPTEAVMEAVFAIVGSGQAARVSFVDFAVATWGNVWLTSYRDPSGHIKPAVEFRSTGRPILFVDAPQLLAWERLAEYALNDVRRIQRNEEMNGWWSRHVLDRHEVPLLPRRPMAKVTWSEQWLRQKYRVWGIKQAARAGTRPQPSEPEQQR